MGVGEECNFSWTRSCFFDVCVLTPIGTDLSCLWNSANLSIGSSGQKGFLTVYTLDTDNTCLLHTSKLSSPCCFVFQFLLSLRPLHHQLGCSLIFEPPMTSSVCTMHACNSTCTCAYMYKYHQHNYALTTHWQSHSSFWFLWLHALVGQKQEQMKVMRLHLSLLLAPHYSTPSQDVGDGAHLVQLCLLLEKQCVKSW